MNLFQVKPMPDEYQSIWYNDQDEQMLKLLKTGESIRHVWECPNLILRDPDEQHLEPPDFPALKFHFLIASERAWKLLRTLVDGAVEALPVRHPSGKKYVALNVIRVIDCLNVEQCRTNRLPNDPDPYFSRIFTYAFDEQKIQNEHLFRCPEMKAFEM